MKERSAALDYIKGLSILSVVCAHCNSVTGSASAFANSSSLILQNLGTFGVICFMVISGLLFHCPVGTKPAFFLKKLKTIVIPWLISASLVWLYVYLRKPPMTLESWARFVIGDGSYLYYLTMLMLFYVIFTFLPFMRTKAALIVCQIITAISCLWFYQIGNLSPYLNPLNWIGFFALGMMMARRKEESVHRGGTSAVIMCASWVLCVALLIMQVLRKAGGFYFGNLNALTSWAGAAALAFLGVWLSRCKENKLLGLLRCAGENSFFIYIWHMPIAGIVAKVASIGPLQHFVLLRPLVVLAIMMVAYKLADVILQKTKLTKLGFLVGVHRS